MINTLWVKHNMEVAHRLSLLPGKCQQIHGHSMQVTLSLLGLTINENGIAGNIDFGSLKKVFRGHIDEVYDHHLHLNESDPWAQMITRYGGDQEDKQVWLPGLITHPGDPTVENLAKWITQDMKKLLRENKIITGWVSDKAIIHVSIQETNTNGADWQEPLNESF